MPTDRWKLKKNTSESETFFFGAVYMGGGGEGGGGGEDPSTNNILEGETTFRWVYTQKCRSVWLPSEAGIKECKRQ